MTTYTDIFDEMQKAVDVYDTKKCRTEIVNYSPADGVNLQEGETFKFKVRVKNEGQLDMLNVQVGAYGSSYATVYRRTLAPGRVIIPEIERGREIIIDPATPSLMASPIISTDIFSLPVLSEVFNLPSGQSYTTNFFYGKAKKATEKKKNIVTAGIVSWDGSLDHILKDHSSWGKFEGVITTPIATP